MKGGYAFDHEKLDVYKLAVEFARWAGEVIDGPLADCNASAVNTTVSGLLPSPGSFAKSQALSLVGRLPPATSLLAPRL